MWICPKMICWEIFYKICIQRWGVYYLSLVHHTQMDGHFNKCDTLVSYPETSTSRPTTSHYLEEKEVLGITHEPLFCQTSNAQGRVLAPPPHLMFAINKKFIIQSISVSAMITFYIYMDLFHNVEAVSSRINKIFRFKSALEWLLYWMSGVIYSCCKKRVKF